MPFPWLSWPGFAVAMVIAVIAVVALVAVTSLVVKVVSRHKPGVNELLAKPRRRLRVLLALVAVEVVLPLAYPHEQSRGLLRHTVLIAIIAAAAWLLTSLVTMFVERALQRFPIDVADNRVARRVHTQANILRRLATVIIWILAIGAILLTFPGAQAVGASLLASAGLASVVAGLAAQSTLTNVFAGMQLAFSDAIRVEDVVIADGEWGRIEEITFTYVVVRTWDERRIVMPSTYFTSTPFQNWTRHSTEIIGAVEIDLDWRISPAQMRAHLDAILEGEELWNGKVKVLQVTDAVGGFVRVRIVVSADHAGKLFDLRCRVREQMVEWLHSRDPGALPHTRVVMLDAKETRPRRSAGGGGGESGFFSGSPEAEERGKVFTGSVPLPPDEPRDS